MKKTHVCPWWAGYTLNNRARRLLHRPEQILGQYLRPGMTALDVGCGMGFFTLPMAELVGQGGRVVAADLQPKMLRGMLDGAQRAGLAGRITAHPCGAHSLGLDSWAGSVDFAILFMMLHEVPDPDRLIRELRGALRPGGAVLFAEPVVHVPGKRYRQSLALFAREGFHLAARPRIAICRAAVLTASL